MRKGRRQNLYPSSAPRGSLEKTSKRRLYADFRHLVFLEKLAKQLKLPAVRHTPASLAQADASTPIEAALDLRQLQLEGFSDNSPLIRRSNVDSRATVPAVRSVLLVIDQRISMFYGSKRKMKSVVAAEAAALVAWRALAQEDRVGAIVFNDSMIVPCPPQCSRLRVMLILHTLLNQNHSLSRNPSRCANPDMLNKALLRAERLAIRDFLVVIITDGSGHNQETQGILANISRENKLLVVLVHDPRQNGFRNAGAFIASHDVDRRKESVDAGFFPNGTSITSLDTRDDIVTRLRRAFMKFSQPPRSTTQPNGTVREMSGLKSEQHNETDASPDMESDGTSMKPEAPLFLACLQKQLPLCEITSSY